MVHGKDSHYCLFQASWPRDRFSRKNLQNSPEAITWQRVNVSLRKLYQMTRKTWPVILHRFTSTTKLLVQYICLHCHHRHMFYSPSTCTVHQFWSSWKLLRAPWSLMISTGLIFRVVWYNFRSDTSTRCQLMASGLFWRFFREKRSRGQLAWKRQ